MSRIVDDKNETGWGVYLTPHGADPYEGAQDDLIAVCPTLAGAALCLAEALADQACDAIEAKRLAIEKAEARNAARRRELALTPRSRTSGGRCGYCKMALCRCSPALLGTHKGGRA